MSKFVESRGLNAVLLLALLARLACLWKYGENLARDVDDYRGIAENIVDGVGYANPGTKLPTAYRPPLYPLVLTLVLWGGNTLIGALHVALGLGTVALTYVIAKRLDLSYRSALLAAALVAVDPLIVYNTSLVMTETLAVMLSAGLLVLLANPNKRPFIVGIVFGLCCLCRPTFWAWGVFLIAWAVPAIVRRITSREARWWAQPTLLTVGLAVVISPWTLRNAIVMGRPVITTTHGGYTLLLGHNPSYYRDVVSQNFVLVWSDGSAIGWHDFLNTSLAMQDPPLTDELSRDRWMYGEALRVIKDDPVMAVRSGIKLLMRLWNIVPLATSDETPKIMICGIVLFNVVVFVFALRGLLSLRREEWQRWWPTVALIASFTAVHFFYWADMRMRAPLVPAIALLAARGLKRNV